MSHVLVPTTWFVNKTRDKMVLIIEDELGFIVGVKEMGPGGHVELSYREGIGRIGAKIHFWVQPKNRADLRGPKIMPTHVFDYANIDVVYKLGDRFVSEYEEGALVGFDFKNGTLFSRIGLVRWIGGFYDSLAKFGTCYHAPPASGPVQVLAPAHVETLAPAPVQVLTQAQAPPPDHQVLVHVESPSQDPLAVEQGPAPATDLNHEIEIVLDSLAQALSPPPAPAAYIDVPAPAQTQSSEIQVVIY